MNWVHVFSTTAFALLVAIAKTQEHDQNTSEAIENDTNSTLASTRSSSATFKQLEYPDSQGTYLLTDGAVCWHDRSYSWSGVGGNIDSQLVLVNGPHKTTPIGTVFKLEVSCDTELYVIFEGTPLSRNGGFDTSLTAHGFAKIEDDNNKMSYLENGNGKMEIWVNYIEANSLWTLPATTKEFVGTIGIRQQCRQSIGCTKTANAAIRNHNTQRLIGKSVVQCESECLAYSWCKSVDYHKLTNKCDLSDKEASDVGGLKTDYAGNPYDHYNCVAGRGFSTCQDCLGAECIGLPICTQATFEKYGWSFSNTGTWYFNNGYWQYPGDGTMTYTFRYSGFLTLKVRNAHIAWKVIVRLNGNTVLTLNAQTSGTISRDVIAGNVVQIQDQGGIMLIEQWDFSSAEVLGAFWANETTTSTSTTKTTTVTSTILTTTTVLTSTILPASRAISPATSTSTSTSSSTVTTSTTSGVKISGVVVIQGPRYTSAGCPCYKEWILQGYENAPVMDYCGNPGAGVGDLGAEWCFAVDFDCFGRNWGYCEPALGDCDIGKEWLVNIDGRETRAKVAGRDRPGVMLRFDGGSSFGSEIIFPWSAIDAIGMDADCSRASTTVTTTVQQISQGVASLAPSLAPTTTTTTGARFQERLIKTQWNSLAFFSATGLWPEAHVRYAEDETCSSLLQKLTTSSNMSLSVGESQNHTKQLSTIWKLDTSVVGNFTLCFCALTCSGGGGRAFWEHVGSVMIGPNILGKFIQMEVQVGKPFDVALEVEELEDFNATGRMKIVWARSHGGCREALASGVMDMHCQPGDSTGCSEGFAPVESKSSIEGVVQLIWPGVTVAASPSASPQLLICYCDPRAWCDSPTGWLPVGILHITPEIPKRFSMESALESSALESSDCAAGAYKSSQHGPPLGLRLTYNAKYVMESKLDFMNSLRAKIAESLNEVKACVQILNVWNGSIIVAFGVAPHRCGAASACEAHILLELQNRWHTAVQDPGSPLRLQYGSSVDTAFPTLLDEDNCLSRGLDCKDNDAANSYQFPLTSNPPSIQENADGGERSEKPREFRILKIAVSGLLTCVLTAGIGYLGRKGWLLARVTLRQRAHASEIKRDVVVLASLGRAEVSLTELGDRARDGCSICLGSFEADDELLLLPCDHLLHYDCVFEWLQRRLTCPLCRCPMALRECLIHVIRASSDDEQQSNDSGQMGRARPSWWVTPSTLANRVVLYNSGNQYTQEIPLPGSVIVDFENENVAVLPVISGFENETIAVLPVISDSHSIITQSIATVTSEDSRSTL